ncbi:MAG TPA: GNAT family N-acetyltransferase [Bacteroidales bacterium]|nr:GNAT family N-acetyltransferase [Bacteroidales bacterium]HPT22258.1 GNAT family N-acetyltransferase [Bacteroidales bacterium]
MKIEKNKITLRKATTGDVEALIDYRIIFLKEAYGDPSADLESVLRESLKDYFARSLKDDSFIFWMAEYESAPVGFSGMVMREQPGNFEIPKGKTGYILNIFTLKEFRGNGIAPMLVNKLIEEGRLRKLSKIELHATREGEQVYRKIGFVEPHDKALEIILE